MAFLVKMLGCGQDTTSYTVLCVLLMMSTSSFRFALPRKWPLCCIGSNITSVCGVVRFATCLARWINSFWLSFSFVTVFVVVSVVNITVRVRGIGGTVFVCGIILIIFSSFSLFFSTSDTYFCNVLVFCSGGTLVWVYRN